MGEIACAWLGRGVRSDPGVFLGREQCGDVVAAKGVVAGAQMCRLGTAQRGEQQDKAGEMAGAKLHGPIRWMHHCCVDFSGNAAGWLENCVDWTRSRLS